MRIALAWDWFSYVHNQPYPECGGCGIANCCEGLQERSDASQAQPEKEQNVRKQENVYPYGH